MKSFAGDPVPTGLVITRVQMCMLMPSPAVEDYLKAIYKLGRQRASTSELASVLDVSSASVTKMMQRLARADLVEYESYRGVHLTSTGEKIALEILRHHRLLETYLREVLGYSWEEMHQEAELLEHHISETFEARIDALLGFPTHDPHGHPIPTADLQVSESSHIPLPEIPPIRSVRIVELSDTHPDRLQILERLGLLPGKCMDVVGRDSDTTTIRVNDQDRVLADDIAGGILVTSEPNGA